MPSQDKALHAIVSVLADGVVKVPSPFVHSSPPLDGAGLLQVLVFVPDVPQAVLQALNSPHPPSLPQSAVDGHAFVVATPQELVQVEIVEAVLPQSVGQSGVQVITSEATHKLVAVTAQASEPTQTVSAALGSLVGAVGAIACSWLTLEETNTTATPTSSITRIKKIDSMTLFLFILSIYLWFGRNLPLKFIVSRLFNFVVAIVSFFMHIVRIRLT